MLFNVLCQWPGRRCTGVEREECRWQMCVQPDHSLQLLLLPGNCSSSAPDPSQLVRKMQQSLNRQLFITVEEVSEPTLLLLRNSSGEMRDAAQYYEE